MSPPEPEVAAEAGSLAGAEALLRHRALPEMKARDAGCRVPLFDYRVEPRSITLRRGTPDFLNLS